MSETLDRNNRIEGGGDCVRCGEQPPPGGTPRPLPLCEACALRTAREFVANFFVCLGCGTVTKAQPVGPDGELACTIVANLVVWLAAADYGDDCAHGICACEEADFCTCGKLGGDATAGVGDTLVTHLVM